MKKIIVAILVIAILTGVGFGIYGIVKAAKSNNSSDDENAVTSRVDLMKDEYTVGEKIVLRVIATSDVQFASVTYAINNGEETELTITTGESDDFEDAIGSGKYYVDTGAEIIDTTSMSAGYYTLVIYAYDANEARFVITSDPIVFKLTAATTAA